MISYPNAKINIGLRVIGKRSDGYHDLITVFYPVPGLHDTLEIESSDRFSFAQTGIAVDCPPDKNLIIKTYHAMQDRYPEIGAVAIRFKKAIPFGAGLGGGSADAAFTCRMLNELFHLGLSDQQMEDIVSPLGADCAFFIQNRPRLATGIGNIFSDTKVDLQGWNLVVVKPNVAVPTRDAYMGLNAPTQYNEERELRIFRTIIDQPVETWQELLVNDFERTVFALHPEIEHIKQQLMDMGATYAAMSGSGASVFGLYRQPVKVNIPDCFVHIEKL